MFPTLYGKPSNGTKIKQWEIKVIAVDIPVIKELMGTLVTSLLFRQKKFLLGKI